MWLDGASGRAARYLLGSEIAGGSQLSLVTFLINVAWALLLGVLLERLGPREDSQSGGVWSGFSPARAFGGFNTYSALATGVLRLWQAG